MTLAYGIPAIPLQALPKGLSPTQSYAFLLKKFLEQLELLILQKAEQSTEMSSAVSFMK